MTLYKKEILYGQIIPAWYGVAWVRYESNSVVCLPVPLNFIAAIVRGIWIWMRHGYRNVPLDVRGAYAQGYADGKRSNAEFSEPPASGGSAGTQGSAANNTEKGQQ